MASDKTSLLNHAWQAQIRIRDNIGLVVLENDAVSGPALQKVFGSRACFQVARMRLPKDPKNVGQFAKYLRTASASIMPYSPPAVIGLACTTGAMRLGRKRLENSIQQAGPKVVAVDPLFAGYSALRHLGVRRVAILSPYSHVKSNQIAGAFQKNGFTISELGVFGARDAEITSIADWSIIQAAEQLAKGRIDGLFLSCTGMRALPLIDAIERRTGKPVATSLSAMAWEFSNILQIPLKGPGRLLSGGNEQARPTPKYVN